MNVQEFLEAVKNCGTHGIKVRVNENNVELVHNIFFECGINYPTSYDDIKYCAYALYAIKNVALYPKYILSFSYCGNDDDDEQFFVNQSEVEYRINF